MNDAFFNHLGEFDCFTQEYVFGGKVYAYISYDDIMSCLIVNLDNGEGPFKHYADWYPKVFDDDGTCLYTIIPADKLITFLEDKHYIPEKTRKVLSERVQKLNYTLRPTNNFLIIKMVPAQ